MRSWRQLFAGLAAVVGPLLVTPAHADTVELKLVSRDDVDALELVFPDIRVSRSPRRGLSDLMVQVSAAGRAADALALPDGAKTAKGRSIFAVRIFLVSQGRLYADAAASCGLWSRDLSICRMDCDGGSFAIRRSPGSGGLDLVVGALPGAEGDDVATGLTLNACAVDSGGEARLVPKPGRTFVELPLGSD